MKEEIVLKPRGWFSNPAKKLKKAEMQYLKESHKRKGSIRDLRANLAKIALNAKEREREHVDAESKRNVHANEYLRQLADKLAPLDSHWNEMNRRGTELKEQVAQFDSLRSEQKVRVQKIEQTIRTVLLSNEERREWLLERKRALDQISEADTIIAKSRKGIEEVEGIRARLEKPRKQLQLHMQTFQSAYKEGTYKRTEETPKLPAQPKIPASAFDEVGISSPDDSDDGVLNEPVILAAPTRERKKLELPSSELLTAILEKMGKTRVALSDYQKIWNENFPRSKIAFPEDGVMTLAEVEDYMKENAANDPNFSNALKNDTEKPPRSLAARLDHMRVQVHFKLTPKI